MTTNTLRICLGQINLTVGDIDGNLARMRTARAQAAEAGAHLIIFPELSVTGYPPEDLVLRRRFQEAARQALIQLEQDTKDGGPAMLVGNIVKENNELYNAAFLLDGGTTQHIIRKSALPNYGVFDEKRVFSSAPPQQTVVWRGIALGIMICEDMWQGDAPRTLSEQGAELLITLNASPYEMGKSTNRREHAGMAAVAAGVPLIYLNLVGGQDELVFDGRSFILGADGKVKGRLTPFGETLGMSDWQKTDNGWECISAPQSDTQDDHVTIYQAMMLSLRDYVEKNHFKGVVLGLSGGIDSGLTAAVAVDALGAERVRGLMMPSPYTSQESLEDARQCADALGIQLDTVPIIPGMQAFDAMLGDIFTGMKADTTEENIQSRLRGNLLMAVSNKLGLMVVTTGNKSEMSVGYATLYGDMCGGYSVLKDVYKTTVFALSHWRNAHKPPFALGPVGHVIPERMITKPPSAELKPGQKDEDSLPPYAVLDAILLRLIEYQQGIGDVVAAGFDRTIVENVSRMLTRAEYKRRQSSPGVKITGMSFGRDRRYPITNGFKG